MKIVVIGATGTIGKAVVEELGARHDVISVGATSGDFQVNITSQDSIEKLYQRIQNIDAVVLATGKVKFASLSEMTAEDHELGLKNKLMGQINVVLTGLKYLNDHGSFTLTSGILNRDPIQYGSSAAMVNGAIDGFVRSAALELPRGLRINAVSPTVISEAMENYEPYFRGFEPVSAARAALSYSKSVEGLQTGQVFKAG